MLTTMFRYTGRLTLCLVLLAVLLTTLGGAPITAVRMPISWHVAPSGKDTDSCGAIEQPCQHIAVAIHKASPYDNVLLHGGIYTETLAITKTLTLASIDPALTVIDGAGIDSVIRVLSNTTTLTITGITVQHGRGSYGGGIDNGDGGHVWLVNSTVVSNTATRAGGGLFNNGTLALVNSTIAQNVAPTGGGIATSAGTLAIASTTISGNGATDRETGGGGLLVRNSAVLVGTTILADNHAAVGADCGGIFQSSGYNLVGSGAGCTIAEAVGDQIGTSRQPIDPRLGPLDRYGGPTPTLTLRTGSPAIDAANPSECGATDQRGIIRPQDEGRCDIGAYEYDVPIIVPELYLPNIRR